MANEHHLKILSKGVAEWNAWRASSPDVVPDLRETDLSGFAFGHLEDLGKNLGIDLHNPRLDRSKLTVGMELSKTRFDRSILRNCDLLGANLSYADFTDADLAGSILINTLLLHTNFTRAVLDRVDFSQTIWLQSVLLQSRMNGARGLDQTMHLGPSVIDPDAIGTLDSKAADFLRRAGLQDAFFSQFLPDTNETTLYPSCFISYSQQDETFAKRLHGRLSELMVPVWYAPHALVGGKKIIEQIEDAIEMYDRLLLILSNSSMSSEWVKSEVRRALQKERQTKKRALFPIRLVSFEELKSWRLFDSDNGKDLAVEVREYFIPDFSGWRKPRVFDDAISRLLSDLMENVEVRPES